MKAVERFEKVLARNPSLPLHVYFYHADMHAGGKPARTVLIVKTKYGAASFSQGSRGNVIKYHDTTTGTPEASFKKLKSTAFFQLKNAGFEKQNIRTEDSGEKAANIRGLRNMTEVVLGDITAVDAYAIAEALLTLYDEKDEQDMSEVVAQAKREERAAAKVKVADFYEQHPSFGSF